MSLGFFRMSKNVLSQKVNLLRHLKIMSHKAISFLMKRCYIVYNLLKQ